MVRKVGVTSVGGSFTWEPNTYTTLGGGHRASERRERSSRPPWRVCASPVDVMAHARDESGQEHERVPVRRFSTRDAAHVAVGAAVALRGQPEHTHAIRTHSFGATGACFSTAHTPPSDGSSHPQAEATEARFPAALG